MMIFIFFIIKPFGALSILWFTIVDSVSMHIIGKTTGENQHNVSTKTSHVLTGNQRISLPDMKTAVLINTNVIKPTDGKSMNTIQSIIELSPVPVDQIVIKARLALIIIIQ